MRRYKFLLFIICAAIFASCNDILDRPSITTAEDDTYWNNEQKVRLYANSFYSYFFVGYGLKYSDVAYTPTNYNFNDDVVSLSTQPQFNRVVPTSLGSTSLGLMWKSDFAGPTWNFSWIRKSNVMIDRLERDMGSVLNANAYNHWMGIARFFRGLEYARLVNVFGDVPYYNHEVKNTDYDALYKDRTPRNEVMDSVYNDFVYAMQNVRLNDGEMYVNRYVVASFVSRWALFEGSWQKYYYHNDERASKFFQLAIEAGDMVINSGKYDIELDFRSLFGSTDLAKTKDCILYRRYDPGQGITHCVASKCNMNSPTDVGPNLDLIKAFICTDGKDYQSSDIKNAKDFSMENMIKTRDSRFEASFYDAPTPLSKSSYLYITKFIPRQALDYLKTGGTPTAEFQGEKNVTAYPVMRYAEVLLNWIEAKAEYATVGGPAVMQTDLDISINKIRNRPLAKEAIAKGVKKTAPMQLTNLNQDPNRDKSVSPLLWEIRRERRMELAFEYARIIDLRRWGKLNYMDTEANEDLLIGTWVNFPKEAKDQLKPANAKKIRVVKANGKKVTFDGTNGAEMVGFFYPSENLPRFPFLDLPNVNPYLAPIGTNQIVDYKNNGYQLTQTEGWPSTAN